MKYLIFLALFLFSYSIHAKTPERIIALAPHIVESLYEIGAGDKIIATVDYADYPEQALDIPRIGGYYGFQMEKILALSPDLIIVWKTGNRAEDIKQLEKLNLPLAYVSGGSIDKVADEIIQLGELTGHQQKAQQVATSYREKLKKLRAKYQKKSPVKVFYQLWSNPMMTVNGESWINQLITLCGGENVFANAETEYPKIGIENVLVAAPELIIIPDEKAKKPQPKIEWQNWPSIPAVKHNRFISVNADVIHRFSTRLLIGVDDMCEKIDHYR